MRTKILKINPDNPEINKIKIAARIIKMGGLVAFPTETVYGLGANAFNQSAIKKIFIAKGRPFDNPLIVHIADKSDLYQLSLRVPRIAEKLAKKFWPGPLTMILKKSNLISKSVTAGLNTIAIRMPDNKIALELIRTSGVPIAAPSANIFTKPSPTMAKHVFDDLKNRIPLILDGGQTKIGLESTVIDLTSKTPTILRPGKITLEDLKEVLGKVEQNQSVAGRPQTEKPRSPGMKYKHYSPKAKVVLVCSKNVKAQILNIKNKYLKQNKKVAIIWANRNIEFLAKNLFRKFREFDDKKIDIIIVENVSEKGLGRAIMNRIKKAASDIVCPRGESNSHGLPH